MSFVIHAPNVHQGGGRTLLNGLLESVEFPCTLLVDERMSISEAISPMVNVIRVQASLSGRIKAERYIQSFCNKGDILLCFGNLPPLFNNKATVYVYLQNRILCSDYPLKGFPLKIKTRICLEKLWIKVLIRNSRLIVQSEAMHKEVETRFGQSALVLPFLPLKYLHGSASLDDKDLGIGKKYDFLYVASGEPYKNHNRLIKAWQILNTYGCKPSLRLTLGKESISVLSRTLIEKYELDIYFGKIDNDEMESLYKTSNALIYPSLLESFGLPLYEAKYYSLPIIASEKDFVRDAVTPVESFDPESPLSIANAVMRFMKYERPVCRAENAKMFIKKLYNYEVE